MRWLINAEAGGMLNDVYQQASPAKNRLATFEGFTIFEGVVNRKIATLLFNELLQDEKEASLVHDPVEDSPVAKRVQLINDIVTKYKDSMVLNLSCNSVEADGFEVWGDASVNDIFGFNLADKIVEFGSYKEMASEETKSFLDAVHCRGVSINMLSYKKETQADFLLKPDNQERIAGCIFQVIKQLESKLI